MGRTQKGSVLIIVMWIAMGLVSLALIFSKTVMLEFRASENTVAASQADMAILGAEQYAKTLLRTYATNGVLPEPDDYENEAVPLGQASFWFLNRPDSDGNSLLPSFGLIDESGKLNINTATYEMLQALPLMTDELAASIIDWRDTDEEASEGGGAESDYYLRLNLSYPSKNGPFESIEELFMVMSATEDILYGEDTNRNGILDENENDGALSPPWDDRNGRLDRGILDFITVFSHSSTAEAGNTNLINVVATGGTELADLLNETFGEDRGGEIVGSINATSPGSLLEFFIRSRMTEEEFDRVSFQLTAFSEDDEEVRTQVNVNTAPVEVLQCIPGIGTEHAASLVAARRGKAQTPQSVAWVAEVLPEENAIQAGPYLTARSNTFSADVVATGRLGKGYRRVFMVFERVEDEISVVYRRDLSRLGFALGSDVMEQILMDREQINL